MRRRRGPKWFDPSTTGQKNAIEVLEQSVVDTAIVTAVVTIARTLQIVAVAEGVETLSQLAHLRKLDCPVVQGYLYSPALPTSELFEWMTLMAAKPSPRPQVPRQRADGSPRSLDLTVTPPHVG